MKQNVTYTRPTGEMIKVQFEHCPNCTYFSGCYENHYPNYISEECFDVEKMTKRKKAE